MAGDNREDLAMTERLRFWKMSGSGNDFVFIDGRAQSTAEFQTPEMIQRICARGTGVGADGLVILTGHEDQAGGSDQRGDGDEVSGSAADAGLVYFNADGSRAALCGNATLCTANLAVRLGAVRPEGFSLRTDSGVLRARIRSSGLAEFDLPSVRDVRPAYAAIPLEGEEQRLGFVTVGIPHVVVRVPDVAAVDLTRRGPVIRRHVSLANGANANFVSREASGGRWLIRTFERGVEAETLACGSGSVATAILLRLWGETGDDVELVTASGRVLGIRTSVSSDGEWSASLRGEGRLVYEGELGDV
jgi:diaminopimelate epimerase